MTDPKLQIATHIADELLVDEQPLGRGGFAWRVARAAALATIEECTERAAKLLRECAAEEISAPINVEGWGEYYADAISRGDHLKGPMSEEVKHTVRLLPCPFCGCEAETLFHQLEETYSAICTGAPKCQAAMLYVGVTEAEAIAAWNTRAALTEDNSKNTGTL